MRELADRPSVDVPVDRLPLFLRGYVVRDAKAKAKEFEAEPKVGPSDEGWTLTFDCETTTDEAQALRFGAYQLRKGDTLKEEGLFHAEGMADDGPDMAVLREVQKARGLKLRNVRHFVDYVFFDKIYQLGGTIIGFNLPFDISRIAVHHGSAQKSMRGGFSFKLSRNTDWPRVRVRHISQRMAFIRYGAPPKKRTPAGQANKGLSVPPRRGYFVDVKTMAAALLSESFNLARLTETLKTEHQKAESDEHGGPLTAEYVAYGLNDVQATWECHQKLAARLVSYRLSTIEAHMLYSEASLGKAYLRVMNVQPWTKAQPDFPPELIGQIVSTYYGGRAEARIRRRPQRGSSTATSYQCIRPFALSWACGGLSSPSKPAGATRLNRRRPSLIASIPKICTTKRHGRSSRRWCSSVQMTTCCLYGRAMVEKAALTSASIGSPHRRRCGSHWRTSSRPKC